MLKRLRNKILLLWHGLFFGLKSADSEMMRQIANKKYDDTEINKQLEKDGVFSDFLNMKETQAVKEYRDSYYRIMREADKFIVTGEYDMKNEWFNDVKVIKKGDSFETQHVIIDESDNLPIKLIQFNKPITHSVGDVMEKSLYSDTEATTEYLFNIKRDGITPRFRLEKYIKKIVVKKTSDAEKYIMDVYVSIYPRQFMKLDELFIKDMKKIYEEKDYGNDIINFKTLDFVSDKAYKVDDLYKFEYGNFKVIDISIFDGNYVIKYVVNAICDGFDLTTKYKTKEMDEKYEKKAPKSNIISMEMAEKMVLKDIIS